MENLRRILSSKTVIKWVDRVINVILGLSLLYILWILSQVFVFASFKIPTHSMIPTLQAGDNIVVWKPIVGARLFDLGATLNLEQTKIYRVPGFRHVRRNDVVVFNFPHPNTWKKIEMHILKYYVKRCIALPGDTFFIHKGHYHVKGVDEPLGNINSQDMIGYMRAEDFPKGTYKAYPFDSLLNWTIKEFGPLYIPNKGGKIKLNRTNYLLYKKAIEWEEGKELTFRNDSIFLAGKRLTDYQFQKNYYFVCGDNCMNSQDSRYWGLLPEEYIVGKACRIWRSIDPDTGKFRWDRFLKKVE